MRLCARRMRRASDGPKPNYITSGLGCFWLGGSLTRAKCIFGGPSRSAAAKRQERSSYARLWRDQGKVQQARELLAPAYGWFTEVRDARSEGSERAAGGVGSVNT